MVKRILITRMLFLPLSNLFTLDFHFSLFPTCEDKWEPGRALTHCCCSPLLPSSFFFFSLLTGVFLTPCFSFTGHCLCGVCTCIQTLVCFCFCYITLNLSVQLRHFYINHFCSGSENRLPQCSSERGAENVDKALNMFLRCVFMFQRGLCRLQPWTLFETLSSYCCNMLFRNEKDFRKHTL